MRNWGLSLFFWCALAFAQYPAKPVTFIVPYGAGGSSDGPMRVIAQEMSKRLGHQMVVENRPGQGAMIGSLEAARSPADGYTLLLASNPNAISAMPMQLRMSTLMISAQSERGSPPTKLLIRNR